MENLILEWQKRQQKYEELAEKYKYDAHNNRKFTYKAMATRDCWKELALQLQQTGVSGCFCKDVDLGKQKCEKQCELCKRLELEYSFKN